MPLCIEMETRETIPCSSLFLFEKLVPCLCGAWKRLECLAFAWILFGKFMEIFEVGKNRRKNFEITILISDRTCNAIPWWMWSISRIHNWIRRWHFARGYYSKMGASLSIDKQTNCCRKINFYHQIKCFPLPIQNSMQSHIYLLK